MLHAERQDAFRDQNVGPFFTVTNVPFSFTQPFLRDLPALALNLTLKWHFSVCSPKNLIPTTSNESKTAK